MMYLLLISTIYTIYNENGTSLKENYMFGEGLYTLWLRMDLLVMCCHKKQSDTTLPNDSHSHKSSTTPLQPSPTPSTIYLRSPACKVRVQRVQTTTSIVWALRYGLYHLFLLILTNLFLQFYVVLPTCYPPPNSMPSQALRAEACRVAMGPVSGQQHNNDNSKGTTNDNMAALPPHPMLHRTAPPPCI